MFLCAVTRISGAVLQVLLPFLDAIKDDLSSVKDDLSSVKRDLASLNETVSNLTWTVGNLSDNLSEKVCNVAETVGNLSGTVTSVSETVGNLRGTVGDLSGDFEEHKSHVTSTLADLQNTLNDNLHTHDMKQDSIDVKIDALDSKQDELDLKLVSVNSELQQTVLSNLTEQLQKTYGYLQESLPHTCGGTAGWRRVVYLDMTDPNTNCPSGWQLTGHSKRTCGRVSITGRLTCDSVTFPVSGGDYTRVCGRIKAYQYDWTDAFQAYDVGLRTTIDGAYVSGVSLTHGSPRQHIWTFAAGATVNEPTWDDACPCDATIDITIPPFVGGDYFCESGAESVQRILFSDNPLWDGEGCSANSTCCSFNSPPYFTKQLPSPTTDDIEARICQWQRIEDTPIEFMELYVQ